MRSRALKAYVRGGSAASPKKIRLCIPAGRDRIDETVKDRKSTRLNSSHSQISYAVFCLKKKKRQLDRSDMKKRYARYPAKITHGDLTPHIVRHSGTPPRRDERRVAHTSMREQRTNDISQ